MKIGRSENLGVFLYGALRCTAMVRCCEISSKMQFHTDCCFIGLLVCTLALIVGLIRLMEKYDADLVCGQLALTEANEIGVMIASNSC